MRGHGVHTIPLMADCVPRADPGGGHIPQPGPLILEEEEGAWEWLGQV